MVKLVYGNLLVNRYKSDEVKSMYQEVKEEVDKKSEYLSDF